MWQGVDRRRFPRANYPCKILVIKKGQTKKISTHTENIGLGGVCVILNEELDRFSEAELILFLNNGQSPICCDARIVWTVRRLTPILKGVPLEIDTGVEFVNLKEEDRLRIEKVVQECLQKQNSQDKT